MRATSRQATVYITKIAAAQRQLDFAIRMYFADEDELAIHTVVAAAFTVLRDIHAKTRGRNFLSDVFVTGVYEIAKRYSEGRLSDEESALFLGDSYLSAKIKELSVLIREQGERFDMSNIRIIASPKRERKALQTDDITNRLKHADREMDHIDLTNLNNER